MAFEGNIDGWFPCWSPDGVNLASGTDILYISETRIGIGNGPKWANTTHVVVNDHDESGIWLVDATVPSTAVLPSSHASDIGANELAAGGNAYVIFTTNPGGQGSLYRSWNTAVIATGCLPRLSANGQFAYVAPYQGDETRQIFLNDNPTPLQTGVIRDAAISNGYVAWIRNNVLFYQTLTDTVPTTALSLSEQDGRLNVVQAANGRPYIVIGTAVGVDVFPANSHVGWRIDTGGQSNYPHAVMIGTTVQIAYSSSKGVEATMNVDVTTSTNASMLTRPDWTVVSVAPSPNPSIADVQIIGGLTTISSPHTYGNSYLRIADAFAQPEIGGIQFGSMGRQYTIYNAANVAVLIRHNCALNDAPDRILTPTSTDTPLPPNSTATLHYDPFVLRWVQS